MSDGIIPAEETDLRTHVQLCAQRHGMLMKRIGRIEMAVWALVILLSGSLGLKDLIPVAKALAGTP